LLPKLKARWFSQMGYHVKIQLPVLCPSSTCEVGAILLGVVQEEGQASLIIDRLVIDQAFVDVARIGRAPEKRFRFANTCIQGACRQWVNKRCTVIDAIIHDIGKSSLPSELPKCSIQCQCRWHAQRGDEACAVCPEVITDLRDSADDSQIATVE
jgi:hypothetical protein